MSEPKLYIADLAAYNASHLYGVWIDATDDVEDIKDTVQTMLDNNPVDDAEEFAIHDCEGFDGYEISEYQGLKSAHGIACFIAEFPEFGGALLGHCCDDIDQARTLAQDSYCGCYHSLAYYAEELTEDASEVPQHLAFYIDYEKMARNWEISGDIFTIEIAHDEIHILVIINQLNTISRFSDSTTCLCFLYVKIDNA